MVDSLMKVPRSVIFAADVTFPRYEELLSAIAGVPGIGGVKIGASLALSVGLARTVESVKKHAPNLVTIYDHQKAATDIPDTGTDFARTLKEAGIDAAILFPHSGPATLEAWIKALQEVGVTVIVGGEMTHPNYLASDGGYIKDDAPGEIYCRGALLGARNFVVPGNKPVKVELYRKTIEAEIGEDTFDLMAPGFITQGGDISETGKVAGGRWHAIVGSGIYKADDPKAAAEALTDQINQSVAEMDEPTARAV